MKKYIIILTMLTFFFTSCDEKLELFPADNIAADNAFSTEGDFENAVLGMYYAMFNDAVGSGYYYGGQLQSFDVMSDNVLISQEGRLSQQFRHEWQYDPNLGFGTFMPQAYLAIQNANFIIASIDNISSDSKDNFLGQALAVRALAHFDLVRFFGKIPTQSSDAGSSLALPYVITPDVTDLPSRIIVSEYYNLLVDDLTLAAELIDSDNGKFQMGKDAVNGLLARVYLHMGNWQGAVDAANKVGTAVGSRNTFVGTWNDSSDDGVIFKLRNDNVSGVTIGVPYNQTANGIKSEYVVDYEFFLEFGDTDIRKTAYIQTSDFAGLSYNHIIKWYSSISTTSLGVVDAKILRAAEVMLTKAEALAELGQDGAALAALDAVRAERYDSFSSGGEVGSVLKAAIALERRLELAFEGSRFSDIKRKGMSIERSEFGHLADGSGLPAIFKTLAAGDDKFQVPIPINEINLNPNMDQNPGYGSN